MTPEQAWNLLASATAQLQLNREGHEKVKQALTVLQPAPPEEDALEDSQE